MELNEVTGHIIDTAMRVHRVGLLINFQEDHLRDGIRRMVNGFDPSTTSAPLRPPC